MVSMKAICSSGVRAWPPNASGHPNPIQPVLPISRANLASNSRLPAGKFRYESKAKIEPLAKLLETRTQLSNLVTYMDGKAGAEKLISKALQDPALLQSLAAAPKPAE